MEPRREVAPLSSLTPEQQEELERIVVRLLEVASRCADLIVRHDLMKLADELVKFIEA